MTNIEQIKRQMPYSSEDEKAYINCQLSNERARGFNEAIDLLHSKGLLMVWQPIETYDYEKFPLVMLAGFITPSEYAQSNGSKPFWEISIGRCWHVNTRKFTGFLGQQPTHWMPLPAAPEGDA